MVSSLYEQCKRVGSMSMLQAVIIKLINFYLAFFIFHFSMTTLFQLGVLLFNTKPRGRLIYEDTFFYTETD